MPKLYFKAHAPKGADVSLRLTGRVLRKGATVDRKINGNSIPSSRASDEVLGLSLIAGDRRVNTGNYASSREGTLPFLSRLALGGVYRNTCLISWVPGSNGVRGLACVSNQIFAAVTVATKPEGIEVCWR